MLNSTLVKKVLITGATGFSGSYVLKGFVDSGWKVEALVRPTSSKRLLEGYEGSVTFHVYDGSMKSVSKAMIQVNPDLVVHMASMVVGLHDKNDVGELIASNVLFGTQLLEAMAEQEVNQIINTGTYWEHYQDAAYNPVGLYAATKYAFQNILKYYVEAEGFSAITLKLFDAYGPADPRSKLINLLLASVENGERLRLSPGEQKLDLVYVDDVVSAYLLAAKYLVGNQGDFSNETYGVRTGCLHSVKEVAGIIEEASGKRLNIEWGGRPYREREVMLPCDRLECLPNWSARVSLMEGLRKMMKDFD